MNKKSQLAKLLATENIEGQQNKVRTASFDVKNRVLTIPIFKHENKDVIDMLIAHECSHALWTGLDDWKSITEESDEFKSYCNNSGINISSKIMKVMRHMLMLLVMRLSIMLNYY